MIFWLNFLKICICLSLVIGKIFNKIPSLHYFITVLIYQLVPMMGIITPQLEKEKQKTLELFKKVIEDMLVADLPSKLIF